MEQIRMVDTPAGLVTYTLIRKRVKNLNLRIKRDGQVILSIPYRCTDNRADQMIREKCDWIAAVKVRQRTDVPDLPPEPTPAECQILLRQALDRIYPRVEPLGVAMPRLKIRKMRSQWGNCHWQQGYITLNAALARCPGNLRDYVTLHELVHFLHHDHGPGFYARMDTLMPDWRVRRKELKRYGAALE